MSKTFAPASRIYYLDDETFPTPGADLPLDPVVVPPDRLTVRAAAVPLPLAVQLFSAFSQQRIGAEDVATTAMTLAQPLAASLRAEEELGAMAQALQAQGQMQAAEALLRQALDAARNDRGEAHPHTLRVQSHLGHLLQQRGKYLEARRLLLNTVAGQRRLMGVEHVDTLATLDHLAMLLCALDELENAEPLLHEAVVLRRRLLGDAHPDSLSSLWHLGQLLAKQGRLDQAEVILEQVVRQQRQFLPATDPQVLAAQASLAEILQQQGRLDEAERLHRDVLALRRQFLGEGHNDTLDSLAQLASLLLQQDRAAEAATLLEQAVTQVLQHREPTGLSATQLQGRYGRALVGTGAYAAAETHLLADYNQLKDVLGQLHQRTQAACSALIGLYRAWNRPEKAAPYRAVAASCS